MPDQKAFLAAVVYDSEQKCTAFVNRLVIGENTFNTSADVVSTILTALGTALTPLATVHALTASSTIVTGGKTAVDADIYAKASTANLYSAIQQTYFKDVQDYTTKLPGLTADQLIVSNEVAKIQSYHALCALVPAEASIAATITPSAGTAPPSGGTGAGASPPAAGGGAAPATKSAVPGQRLGQ